MRFTESTAVDHVAPEEAPLYTAKALDNVASILNNGIWPPDNFDAKTITLTFSSANTDTASMHGLGRVPTGYIVVGVNAAIVVYDGASANSAQLIYLRASGTGTARVMVY